MLGLHFGYKVGSNRLDYGCIVIQCCADASYGDEAGASEVEGRVIHIATSEISAKQGIKGHNYCGRIRP